VIIKRTCFVLRHGGWVASFVHIDANRPSVFTLRSTIDTWVGRGNKNWSVKRTRCAYVQGRHCADCGKRHAYKHGYCKWCCNERRKMAVAR
jgi:hypothetical protein